MTETENNVLGETDAFLLAERKMAGNVCERYDVCRLPLATRGLARSKGRSL